MSLPQPAPVLPPERRRPLAIAAGVVLGCVVLSLVLGYATGNGTWFMAWWLAFVAAILLGRYTGWLWGPRGRHAARRGADEAAIRAEQQPGQLKLRGPASAVERQPERA